MIWCKKCVYPEIAIDFSFDEMVLFWLQIKGTS